LFHQIVDAIDRKIAVNIERVERLEYVSDEKYKIVLCSGEEFTVEGSFKLTMKQFNNMRRR
jgi:hypothetical protein